VPLLAPPPLWVPRRLRRPAPAWRPIIPLLNGPGARLVDATTGKRLVNATTGVRQAVVTTAEDCECCGVVDCSNCMTMNATVTLAGVVPLAGCGFNAQLVGGTISETYSLPNIAPPPSGISCAYGGIFASSYRFQVHEFVDPMDPTYDCLGEINCTTTKIVVSLEKSSATNKWKVVAYLTDDTETGLFLAFESAEFDEIGWCWTDTVDNTLADDGYILQGTCTMTSSQAHYTGGTATITVGP
jgi:hypothetical protein